jgi:FkbM family methyltransferase
MKFLTYPIKFFRHLIKAKKNLNSVDNYLKNNYCGNDWKHWNSFEKNIWLQLSPIFNNFKIYTIVHVGAHTGAEALAINKLFPGREFYLLEPLPNIYKVLVKNTASYKNMHCINMAAGAGRGLFDMWADEFSPASSLLPYEELAYKEFPYLGKQAITKVNVETLDNIL